MLHRVAAVWAGRGARRKGRWKRRDWEEVQERELWDYLIPYHTGGLSCTSSGLLVVVGDFRKVLIMVVVNVVDVVDVVYVVDVVAVVEDNPSARSQGGSQVVSESEHRARAQRNPDHWKLRSWCSTRDININIYYYQHI